ncbi:MAG: type 4a pilus biogenesis protein PilO [Candidatus Lernaella stagnicola]|nr:type 4a pilus biogenesis protein PilO [Candidatus Lernaella stagnicola]
MAKIAKVLVIVALVFLVFGVYYFLGYRPTLEKIDRANKYLADLTTQLNEVKAVAKVLQPIQREIETLDQQLQQSLAQLPEEKRLESLLRSLEDLASTSGLEIAKVQPSAEIARDFYAAIPIELQIKGGYHNIAIFFDKISKLKRVVNISNLKVGQPTEVGGEVQVTADCIATTFRFRKTGG